MAYTDIDTFEKALEANGETLEQFNSRTQSMSVGTQGYEKVKAIVLAINGGINVGEGYFPWFKNSNKSLADFEYDASGYRLDLSIVSGDQLYIDLDRAEFAGMTFAKEYSQFINSKLD